MNSSYSFYGYINKTYPLVDMCWKWLTDVKNKREVLTDSELETFENVGR